MRWPPSVRIGSWKETRADTCGQRVALFRRSQGLEHAELREFGLTPRFPVIPCAGRTGRGMRQSNRPLASVAKDFREGMDIGDVSNLVNRRGVPQKDGRNAVTAPVPSLRSWTVTARSPTAEITDESDGSGNPA